MPTFPQIVQGRSASCTLRSCTTIVAGNSFTLLSTSSTQISDEWQSALNGRLEAYRTISEGEEHLLCFPKALIARQGQSLAISSLIIACAHLPLPRSCSPLDRGSRGRRSSLEYVEYVRACWTTAECSRLTSRSETLLSAFPQVDFGG